MLFGKKKEKEQRSVLEEEQMQSPFRTIIKNLLENKLAMGGLIVFIRIQHRKISHRDFHSFRFRQI